jgi:hypothetical protein
MQILETVSVQIFRYIYCLTCERPTHSEYGVQYHNATLTKDNSAWERGKQADV